MLGVSGVVGSDFDETLRGNARMNLLAGMGGNDTIDGLANEDCVGRDRCLNAELRTRCP